MIYQILKQEILNGFYEPGEKLIISRLAIRFESSEIPVREAMNLLKSEKLIEIRPHVGAIVNILSSKDIQEIFELRIELEGLATRLAVEGLTNEGLNDLRYILDQSNNAYKEKKFIQFEALNIQFHKKIYSLSNNKLLIRTIDDLWSNTKRYPSLFKENDEHIKKSIEEHEMIYKSLLQKDGMLAENYMIKHKARAGKEILRINQRKFYEQLNNLINKH